MYISLSSVKVDELLDNSEKKPTYSVNHTYFNIVYWLLYMNIFTRNPASGFQTRPDSNRAVLTQKMDRCLKFRI